MVRLDINNWYRLEGYIVPVSEYNYTTDVNNIASLDIWYTNVEVQLQNPTVGNFIHGVNYKTMTFEEMGLTTIEEISANFQIVNEMINTMNTNEGALTYTGKFVVSSSSVICYGDAYSPVLDKVIVILKDDYLTANISAITAVYDGPSVAMDENFSHEYLTVTGHFNDGHASKFMEGTYVVARGDRFITNKIEKVGSNVFLALLIYGENEWQAAFVVPGVKRVTEITATYDGSSVAINKKPMRKNIVVIANYSDGSASTITDWTYKNGDTITLVNKGILDIYYQGFECKVTVINYEASATQLKAFYNGPKVETGHNFLINYLTVKIYYQDAANLNSYWEVLLPEYYVIDSTLVKFPSDNIITVRYTTNEGTVLSTNFIVEGFEPEKEILYLTAEYTGPPIMAGKTYNPSKIVCKAYWNDNSVSLINDFTVSTILVEAVGLNTITLNYKEDSCTFGITGVSPESTSGTTYSPTHINLLYPEATRLNHRRRGPMESKKFDESSQFIYDNITRLYNIYNQLESNYKAICSSVSSLSNTGANTLNTCSIIDDKIKVIKERG